MSTPMWDMPDHLAIPVDELGNGPADEADTVATACWCGNWECTEVPFQRMVK
jgi:hypothetical protein